MKRLVLMIVLALCSQVSADPHTMLEAEAQWVEANNAYWPAFYLLDTRPERGGPKGDLHDAITACEDAMQAMSDAKGNAIQAGCDPNCQTFSDADDLSIVGAQNMNVAAGFKTQYDTALDDYRHDDFWGDIFHSYAMSDFAFHSWVDSEAHAVDALAKGTSALQHYQTATTFLLSAKTKYKQCAAGH